MVLRSTVALSAVALGALVHAQEPKRQRKVAVTIDDGPATGPGRDIAAFQRISRSLREIFVAEKVPAIMFVNERQFNVDGQRDARVALLHEWLDAGLDLGNHTYSHPNLTQVGAQRFMDDIVQGEVISRAALEQRGKKLVWFRYPFLASGSGEVAKAVEDFLGQRGYRIAPVTVDYQDYSFAGTYVRHLRAGETQKAEEHFGVVMQTLDHGFSRAEARSLEIFGYEAPLVLLIHCNEMNALTLRRAIQRMRDRGYRFVSIDEAMEDPAYRTPGLRPGAMGGGFFNGVAAAKRAANSTP
jgi:peptidoglycan/xylan/chitin deacetylase (PgdA/CDA1 family)